MDQSRVVRAQGIGKYFGDVVALDGVDLEVAAGEIHGLIGPNGAGKTTLLGLLLGLAVADEGSLTLFGTPIGRTLQVPDGVAGFVDGPGLYPALSPRRNLRALARLRGGGRGARADADTAIDALIAEVGLTDVADDPVRGFSLGMRQRLGLAAALLDRPRLLVLDEPANGLDPAGTRQVHRILTRLAAEGTAVVLSSHRMDDLAALCSTVTLLRAGRVVFGGSVRDLATTPGALDYRVRTSDPSRARALAERIGRLELRPDDGRRVPDPDTLVVRAAEPALDAFVRALVLDGVAVRELAPLIAPLEAAYLALTEPADEAGDPDERATSAARAGSRTAVRPAARPAAKRDTDRVLTGADR